MWMCKHCNRSFAFTEISEKANHSRWCSSNPKRNDWNKTQKAISQWGSYKEFTVSCARCDCAFTVREREKLFPSKKTYYCSRSCANNRQDWWDENATGYRTIAFRDSKPECGLCGITETYLLVVHHIDGNRDNNLRENLKVLCFNCHARHHLAEVDGTWRYRSSALTPAEKLELFGVIV